MLFPECLAVLPDVLTEVVLSLAAYSEISGSLN